MLAIAKDTAPKDLFRSVSITAQIFDQGIPAVDALVLLTNGTVQPDLSNVIRMTRSDVAGIYRFQDLIPGSYGLAIFFDGSTSPEVFNNLFDNLQSDYVSPGLDPTLAITVPVTTAPVIVDSEVVDITITNPGSGYSKNLAPMLAYPGGFTAKAVVNDQGSVVSYDILSRGVATDIGETDSAVSISIASDDKRLRQPGEITYGEESGADSTSLWAAYAAVTTRASLSFQSALRSRAEYPPFSYNYNFSYPFGQSGPMPSNATSLFASKLIQRSQSYDIRVNTPTPQVLNYRTDYNLILGPELTFYPGSESNMSVLLNYDFFSVVGLIGGPVVRVQTFIAVATSLAGSLVKKNPLFTEIEVLMPAVPDDGPVYSHPFLPDWISQVYNPYVAKIYGGYSDYLVSRIQQAAAYETLVRPALDPIPLQEGNSPTESTAINQEVESSLWQDWSNFVFDTFSNPYFVEQQQIYQSVKSKGQELLAQGLITEKEFNYAKGFVGRTQFIEPLLDGTFELPSSILPSRALTLVGILAWQAKDAFVTGDIVDAIFDFSTQSLGSVALKPPQWVNETTFDVFDPNTETTVQKRYINGQWQSVQ